MKARQIEVCGYKVDVNNFGYATYMYPAFNGNAEYRATHKGFRQLSSYLRTVRWMQEMYKKTFKSSENL